MKNLASTAPHPWDAVDYQRIVAAGFANGTVSVRFANGDLAHVAPAALFPNPQRRPDWPALTHRDFHLCVPSPTGEIEIPWDVIRVRSDPDFDAHWAQIVTARSTAPVPASGT